MGRKTWDSLPRRPLVGRTNIVVSRQRSLQLDGALTCEHFTDALALDRAQAAADGDDHPFVIRVPERLAGLTP